MSRGVRLEAERAAETEVRAIGTADRMLSSRLILWRVRLVGGLFLLLFVARHLGNLALGLVSIDPMEGSRSLLLRPWQTGFSQALLLAAAIVHTGLGLASPIRGR